MGNTEDELVLEFDLSKGWKKKVCRHLEGDSQEKDTVTYLSPTGEEVTDMAEYLKNNPGSSTLQFEGSSTIPTSETVNQAGGCLPEELVRSILCRLPDKALARFQTAHTSWRLLIRDPSFIRMHVQLGVCNFPTLFIEGHSTQLGSKHYLMGQDGQLTSLTGNKLENMCVKGSTKSCILLTSREKRENTQLIIFDIETLLRKQLPCVKGVYYDLILGYDSVESDLKVCRVFCDNKTDWQYDILSVNEGKWGRICAFPSLVQDVHLPALVREEKVYYLVSGDNDVFLMSVDLTSKECTLDTCPDCIDVMWSQLVLVYRKLSLCMVNQYTNVTIWFFQDNVWIKSFIISLDDEVTLVRRNMEFLIAPLDLDNNIGVVMRNELKVYTLTTKIPQNVQVPRATLTLQVPWATSLTPWKVESCFLQRATSTRSLTAGEEKAEEEVEEEEAMGESEVFELEI